LYYLRIKKRFAPQEYWNATYYVHEPNPVGIKWEVIKPQGPLVALWSSLYTTVFYDPWFWLLLNTLLFVFFLRRYLKRRTPMDKVLAALQLSALVFMLCQFPVFQHDRDFRYNYWNVIAVAIGLAFLPVRENGAQEDAPVKHGDV
jgi:hypothetical protein